MDRRSVFFLGVGGLIGLLVVVIGLMVFQRPYQYQGSLLDPPLQPDNFTLQDQNGQPFTLQEQEGNVVLLFFGYTSCPDVCPATLVEYKHVHQALGEQAERVRFVFITVDPERDTPDLVGDYVAKFNSSFIGLSGTEAELKPVWDDFFVFREIPEHEIGAFYLVGHTGHVYAIDTEGKLRLTYPFGMGAEVITADVSQLLKEG